MVEQVAPVSKTKKARISQFCRLNVYKFLKFKELIGLISVLSRQERKSIQRSHIVNENRPWNCKVKDLATFHANFGDHRVQNKLAFFLSLIEKVNFLVVGSSPPILLRFIEELYNCLLYTSPSPRDQRGSRMPSSA